MKDLPVMCCIPKMHKNPISFHFIIASPVCSIKPLAKDITSIFKLFYEKLERYHIKGKVWSGIKAFWTIQKSYPVISSINKLNKRKAAKSRSTFSLSTLYTKIPHDKLTLLLKVGQEIILLFIIQEHFGYNPKVKLEDLTLSEK